MAFAEKYALDTTIKYKAGANASATAIGAAYLLAFSEMAECTINSMTRYDWSSAYAGLDDYVKGILLDAGSSLAAMYVINYDLSGFTSLNEAALMLNVLRDSFIRNVEILKELKNQDFIKAA